MRKITAKVFGLINIVWSFILVIALILIYLAGDRPFSVDFVVELIVWIGAVVSFILFLASYFSERIEELENKIVKK